MIVKHYATSEGYQEIEEVPISAQGQPFKYYTLFHLLLPRLETGNIVQAQGQFKATNNLVDTPVTLYQAMFIYTRRITYAGTQSRPSDYNIVRPCFFAGEVIAQNTMQHCFRSISGSMEVIVGGRDYWLNVVVCCSYDHTDPDNSLVIEQGCGGISASVFRG